MLRTVLPALAQAVVMNFCPTMHQEGTAENLKEKLQVHSATICFHLCFCMNVLFHYIVCTFDS